MVFLWWCCGPVFVVVVQWCQHPARELVLFGVLQDCGFALAVFVVVFLKWSGGVFVVVVQWCQHPARELVLFGGLQDCGFALAVFVVVFLKWSGGVFVVVVWSCQHPARELVLFGVLQQRCSGPWYHDPSAHRTSWYDGVNS